MSEIYKCCDNPQITYLAAVNMYRKMCERENIDFKKNSIVDNLGVALEDPYDDVRTKYNKKP